LVSRSVFLAALESPFLRREVDRLVEVPGAGPRGLPCSPIIPAPVMSRSFFTSLAAMLIGFLSRRARGVRRGTAGHACSLGSPEGAGGVRRGRGRREASGADGEGRLRSRRGPRPVPWSATASSRPGRRPRAGRGVRSGRCDRQMLRPSLIASASRLGDQLDRADASSLAGEPGKSDCGSGRNWCPRFRSPGSRACSIRRRRSPRGRRRRWKTTVRPAPHVLDARQRLVEPGCASWASESLSFLVRCANFASVLEGLELLEACRSSASRSAQLVSRPPQPALVDVEHSRSAGPRERRISWACFLVPTKSTDLALRRPCRERSSSRPAAG